MTPDGFPRVQAIPDHPDRASLRVDGAERVGYEFNPGGTRPFLYPLLGPSGHVLTRMGHPNPVGHEHHKSIWFGHQDVAGINFWEDAPSSDVRIAHDRVLHYTDGQHWAGLVAESSWRGKGRSWLTQQLILVLEPQPDGSYFLDFQTQLAAASAAVTIGKSNFGFLGVRVAKSMSERFGAGVLTNDLGDTGETAIFGKPSRWMDYSGPVAAGIVEGISYLDHPTNPRQPTAWHVRSDGWMIASPTMAEGFLIPPDHPLELRYRLWIHRGPANLAEIGEVSQAFDALPPYEVAPAEGQTLGRIVRRGS